MSEVISIDQVYSWTVNKLSSVFDLNRRGVSQRLKAAGIIPAIDGRGYEVYPLKEAAEALFAKRAGSPSPKLDLDQYPEARKAWYQSENERIKFETATGELILKSEHVRALAFMAKNFAAAYDSLPDQLERDAGLPPEALEVVLNVCDAAREVTYEALLKYTGVPEVATSKEEENPGP